MNSRLTLAGICLLAAFGLAACGGGGGGSASGPRTPVTPGPETPGPETPASALATAVELDGRLADVDVAQSLADAIENAGKLTSEEVNGDSAMAVANAQAVLDADSAIRQAVMDADAVIDEATAAKEAAEAIEDEAEKAAVMRLLDDAIETANAVKAAAEAIIADTTISGDNADLDTLGEAVAAVEGDDEAMPNTAAAAGEAVAAAVKTAIGDAREGTGTIPDTAVRMNDSMAIGAMTWAGIVGEDNVMDINRLANNAVSQVKSMSVAGSMSADLAATGASPPTSGADSDYGDDFDAVYKGIDGTVFCAGVDCKTDADGNLTGSWYFTPDLMTELYVPAAMGSSYMVATMYARYGYWLTYNNGDATAVNTFSSSTGDTANLNLAGEGDPVADVTATYSGHAVGISEHNKASGQFTANVNLTATFGETPMLGGNINGFQGEAVNPNWDVLLEKTGLGTNGALSQTGVAHGDRGAAAGEWTANGYGPAQTPADGDNLAVDHRPTGFHGRFDANFTDGSAAGAYATRADD